MKWYPVALPPPPPSTVIHIKPFFSEQSKWVS